MMSIPRRPQFDGLEFRTVPSTLSGVDHCLFNGPTFTIQAAPPAPLVTFGSPSNRPSLEGSTALVVTFGDSVDPFSLNFPDLMLTRMTSASEPGSAVVAVGASRDPSDASSLRGILPLNAPLGPGTYHLSLREGTTLTDVADRLIAPDAGPVIDSFTVADTAPQAPAATDLGVVGDAAMAVPGDVDLAAGPAGPRLYRFTLAPGGPWDLSLNATAQSDGGTLDAALTLMDSEGRPIRSGDGGSLDTPFGPSFRARLEPGTYFIQVSGTSTVGGTDGSFRLNAAARPAAAPVGLAQVSPIRANPLSGQATGLMLTFSGEVDPQSFGRAAVTSLTLVDGAGRNFPLVPAGFTADLTSVVFKFTSEVPAGSYTIQVDPTGGPTDAVGQPLAAAGGSGLTLGTVQVAAASRFAPDDLGTLWPQAGCSLSLAPGGSASRTFTILDDGTERISLAGDVGSARIVIRDLQGNEVGSVAEGPRPGHPEESYRSWLATPLAGTYTITVFNDGDTPASLDLNVEILSKQDESILNVGIGQGPAVGSQVMGSFADGAGAPGVFLARSVAASGPASPANPAAPAGRVSDAAEVGLLAAREAGDSAASPTLLAGSPAGRPGINFDVIGTVGPAALGRSTGVALNRAIQAARPLGQGEGLGNGLNTVTNPIGQGRADARSGQELRHTGPGDEIAVTEGMGQADRDGRVLAQAFPVDGFTLASWAGAESLAPAPLIPEAAVAITPDGPADFSRAVPEDASLTTEYASLSPPVVVIGSIFAAYRARLGIRRWARRAAHTAHAILDPRSDRR